MLKLTNKKINNEEDFSANIWFVANSNNIRISRIPPAVLDDLITFTDDQIYCLSEDVVMSYFWELFFNTNSDDSDDHDKIGFAYEDFTESIRRSDFPQYVNTKDMLQSLTHRMNSFITIIVIARRSGIAKINDIMLWDCVYEDSRASPVLKRKKNGAVSKNYKKGSPVKLIKKPSISSAVSRKLKPISQEGDTIAECIRMAFLVGDIDSVKKFSQEKKDLDQYNS